VSLSNSTAEPQATQADRVILAIALTLPTLVTWLYFVALAQQPTAVQQGAFGVGKVVQFALPVVWVGCLAGLFSRSRPQPKSQVPPGRRDLLSIVLGLAFGIAVMGAMAGLYYFCLKPAGLFERPMLEVQEKVASFGIRSAAGYIALAMFYSLAHSLLEEYYWRWFVFGHCCRGLRPATAVPLSSVGFAAHHVLVLGAYFGYGSPLTWLFSAGIVIGGAFWAWLYRRSGSLIGPWLSHTLVDAAIFVIGWDLVRFSWV
jgi:membrane protease YdiL (CAAX protease family)